jgi:predicted NBD/HSP70 family sugar kinase
MNRQIVLGHVHAHAPIGRAEIARRSGLTTQAVSNIIAELHGDGLLVERGRRTGSRGLPAVQYAVNPEGGFALGIEIRPTVLLLALLDLSGTAVFTCRRSLSRSTPDTVLGMVGRLRDAALSRVGAAPERLLGAGVVMPGPFGTTGLADDGAILTGWEETDAQACFSDVLDVPVFVENDANAAAMAERISGVAVGLGTYAFLYFGAGLGLGLVSQGTLVRGAFGNAGEIGHLRVTGPDGPIALELAASRLSVQRHLRSAGVEAEDIDSLESLHAAGHPALAEWLDSAAGALGQAVHVVENLFDPETMILGGAMPGGLLDALIERIALPVSSVSNRAGRAIPRLQRGASGRMTATEGAAALVLNRTFTPQLAAAH